MLSSNIIDSRLARRMEEANADRATLNTRSRLQLVMSHYDHNNPITCEAANVAMRTPINKSTEVSVLCKYIYIFVVVVMINWPSIYGLRYHLKRLVFFSYNLFHYYPKSPRAW